MEKKEGIIKRWFTSIDFGLVVIIISLLCIGVVMVASASSYYALINYGNSGYFFYRQLLFAIVGVIAMIVISVMDYKKFKKWSYLAFVVSAILLLLVATPLGVTVKGAKRWLGVGELFRFQPSEIMKPVLVLAIATYISRNINKYKGVRLYIVPIIFMLIVMLFMYFQKHMSGALVLATAALSVIFFSLPKVKVKYVAIFIIIASAVVAAFILSDSGEYRQDRIDAFQNAESDLDGVNWQSVQSLYAIGSGGLLGKGLGQSTQKYLWLPEAPNDFIFAVFAEEFGFVGCLVVIGLFACLIYKGYKIALTCKDLFGTLVAGGITTYLAIQIIINIAVVTRLMPVTGMPLPFFSYGGTSLFINLCSMGIILSISKNCEKKETKA